MSAPRDFRLIVGYGSDMGNAEFAATSFAEALGDTAGIDVNAVELNDVEPAHLQSVSHFIAVTSTFGLGEFPDNAASFWESLSSAQACRLDHLSFAVLALGDSGHEHFCNAGRLLDARLEELGGTRLAARVDVDGPDMRPAEAWTTELVALLSAHVAPAAACTA